jgi:hypothetical protein
MIGDDDIQRALDWMVANTDKAAKARADRLLIEESLKPLKAQMMKASGQDSLGAQERDALASPEYQTHLDGLRAAVYEDERYRLLYKAAEARLEAWRTLSSNNRALGKVG